MDLQGPRQLTSKPLRLQVSFLNEEARGEARHQGKGTARVLADFAHSQFTASEEGPGGWREQRQASFSRSPGSEIKIHNQHGQQVCV